MDDSDLSLNLCLGETFQGKSLFYDKHMRMIIPYQFLLVVLSSPCLGGSLYFINTQGEYEATIPQVPGTAILHPGHKIHGADAITSGERYNLIAWFKRKDSFKYFSHLPSGIQIHIFSFLNAMELCKVRSSCGVDEERFNGVVKQ